MDRTRHFIEAKHTGPALIIGQALLSNQDLVEVAITLSAVPTSAGLITISRRHPSDPAYNVNIRQLDPVKLGLTDLLCVGEPVMAYYRRGDLIDVTYANPNALTVGVRCTLRGAK